MFLSSASLIQGSFGWPGNFEVVLTRPEPKGPGEVRHYWRENDRVHKGWRAGSVVTYGARGPAGIVQALDSSLHVVVPLTRALGHFRMDPATKHWSCLSTFAHGATNEGALCLNRDNGNLEVLALHGKLLAHYWYDRAGWHLGRIVSHEARDAGALIQNRNKNLEALVLEGQQLKLYWRDDHDPEGLWRPGGLVADQASASGAFVQAVHGPADNPNFEAVVPEGDRLRHYWRDHSRAGWPWMPGAVITAGRGSIQAAAIATTRIDGTNLDVLVQEGDSVFHYYRTSGMRWLRGSCLRIDEGPVANAGTSAKVRQLTGQVEFPSGEPIPETAAHGIRGTDLGAAFEHRGRYYFLFGDTHWLDGRCPALRDVIATAPAAVSADALRLRFSRSCLELRGGDVTMAEFDVPLDGFSHDGQMYAFFTSNHARERRVMYRSILARCSSSDPGHDIDESYRPGTPPPPPLAFQYVSELSSEAFTNVSVALASAEEIRRFELPASERALLIWGSGAYRADVVVLACLPLPAGTPPDLERIRYFSGFAGVHPRWSPPGLAHEASARPLFYPAAIGELSVRWDPRIERWLLLYCTGPEDPAGLCVTLRTSRAPWGPWSRRRVVLDWGRDALGEFIHRAGADDNLHQGIHPPDGSGDGGGAYAPYLLPHLTQVEQGGFTLCYLLSTWNPYQTVLMRHRLTGADVLQLDGLIDDVRGE